MLQHLEAADGASELLPQLDVIKRDVERRGGKADEFGRRAQHQEVLQLQGQSLRFGTSRDHAAPQEHGRRRR